MPDTAPLTQTFYAVVPPVAQETATFYILLPATNANADFEAAACVAPWAGTLTSATYIADTAITGANTESRTMQIINKGAAGSGSTAMAELTLVQGTNAAAFDETALTLSATPANLVVAAGHVLSAKSLHVGSTGLADPGGTVKIVLTRTYVDAETTVCVAPWAGTVTEVTYAADTAITGADTNSRTLSLINKGGAGSGTTAVASLALVNGVDCAAFDEKALTLSGTAAHLVVAAGDALAFKSAVVGTGIADPGGTVKVVLSRS